MEYLVLFFEIALAFFIVFAWWTAKHDLNAEASKNRAASESELKELRETVEQLITVLEQKAGAAERRLQGLTERASRLVSDSPREPDASPVSAPIPIASEPSSSSMPATQLNTLAIPSSDGFESKLAASIAASTDAIKAAQVSEQSTSGNETGMQFEDVVSTVDPYAKVYALVDSGVSDASEIAKQTGLGQAEVAMVLSLRPGIRGKR
jgi:hypothetical protein